MLSLAAAANATLLAAVTIMLFLPNPKRLLLGYLVAPERTVVEVQRFRAWLTRSGGAWRSTASPASACFSSPAIVGFVT